MPALHQSRSGAPGRCTVHDSTVRPLCGGCAKMPGFFATPPLIMVPTPPAPKGAPGMTSSPCTPLQTWKGNAPRLVPTAAALPGCVKMVKRPGSGTVDAVPDEPFSEKEPSPEKPEYVDPGASV